MCHPRLRGTRHGLRENTDWSECSQAPCGSQWKGTHWLSNVCPVKLRGIDGSTQHSDGTRFVAHIVLRNSGLLLSRSDLKALGATIDLRSEQMHLENLRVTLKLFTTPAGHDEIDLLNRTREAAGVDSLDKTPGVLLSPWQ